MFVQYLLSNFLVLLIVLRSQDSLCQFATAKEEMRILSLFRFIASEANPELLIASVTKNSCVYHCKVWSIIINNLGVLIYHRNEKIVLHPNKLFTIFVKSCYEQLSTFISFCA